MKRRNQKPRKVQIESMVDRAARPRHASQKSSAKHHTKKSSKIRLRDETLREGAIRVREYVSPAAKRTRRFAPAGRSRSL